MNSYLSHKNTEAMLEDSRSRAAELSLQRNLSNQGGLQRPISKSSVFPQASMVRVRPMKRRRMRAAE